MLTNRWRCLCLAATTVVVFAATVHANDKLTAETMKKWGNSQHLFTAQLDSVVGGPTGLSHPPLYTTRLGMTVKEIFRGSLETGKAVRGAHSVRQMKRPVFPEGKLCIVAASDARGHLRVNAIAEATDEELSQFRLAMSVPLGWQVTDDGLESPWAKMKDAWPKGASPDGYQLCAKTGRPALLMGSGAKLTVEKVPPGKDIKWTNPDGDGEYKITVTNTTDQPIKVPALLTDGENILWKESLVILCQNKVYAIPGARGVKEKPTVAELEPGQSVSTVVNALALQGPEWPRGGYRIEFQFCLGEQSSMQSFYYMSRHHDALREAATTGVQ
jgi:hypothetical protein